MQMREPLRQAALFIGLSGAGWLLDTAVFLSLSGPGGWPLLAANLVSGSCGALFVFAVSSQGVFRRNDGPLATKIGALLVFNAAVIMASSAALAAIARGLVAAGLPAPLVPLSAKVLVTPVTLLLNFLMVRFLLERFVGPMRRRNRVELAR